MSFIRLNFKVPYLLKVSTCYFTFHIKHFFGMVSITTRVEVTQSETTIQSEIDTS